MVSYVCTKKTGGGSCDYLFMVCFTSDAVLQADHRHTTRRANSFRRITLSALHHSWHRSRGRESGATLTTVSDRRWWPFFGRCREEECPQIGRKWPRERRRGLRALSVSRNQYDTSRSDFFISTRTHLTGSSLPLTYILIDSRNRSFESTSYNPFHPFCSSLYYIIHKTLNGGPFEDTLHYYEVGVLTRISNDPSHLVCSMPFLDKTNSASKA